jgi:hypothetical protein
VYLSKIWFFLVALIAAAALTIALVMPRPAQRTLDNEQRSRLAVGCGVVGILLADDARNRVELAATIARETTIVSALEGASGAEVLDDTRRRQVTEAYERLVSPIKHLKPDFAWLVDRRGRVVARINLDAGDYGDTVAGRPLVDDALTGYQRDDLWAMNGTMYLVSAAPVVKRDPPVAYGGAVVLGHKLSNELSQKLVASLKGSSTRPDVDVAFYLGKDDVAASKATQLDQQVLSDHLAKLAGTKPGEDCLQDAFTLRAGNDDYLAVVARMPGEAQLRQASFSVFMKKPAARGFAGTLKAVDKDDLSFGNFPWLLVGALFVLALGGGIGLMWFESDRPLRRLAADAVRLAKKEQERLREDAHGGKYGSIARSVNIHIDVLGRDAKSARTNLDSLLGPAPEGGLGGGGLGTIDLLAGSLPPVRPGGPAPAVAPPPSDFRFGDATPAPMVAPSSRAGAAPPFPRQPTPPPVPMPRAASSPPPGPSSTSAPLRLDDDILGSLGGGSDSPSDDPVDPYFKQVYDQFLAAKKSCNEPTTGLTYQKFAEKLVRNRDDLIAKTGCREVRFTVYVKDGKAALKATPVKDA